MADRKHVEQLKRSITEWNKWRHEYPDTRLDLIGADLSYTNLSHAHLGYADLSGADLSYTNLSHAYLSGADLSYTNLSGANLSSATLYYTNLSYTNLSDADFNWAFFHFTVFAWVDLSNVKGLETARHSGPSTVNVNSVTLPQNEQARLHFLRGVGFSDAFIEYLPSLLTLAIQYHSLFIAYAHQDEILARRLYLDLQDNGVRCWMAPHDLRPGDYHHSRIDEAIHLHEKTLLLLSEHAVNSSWVKHEVQIALAREVAQDCTVLFSLRLDEAIMHTSKDWAMRLRESRHIGDFTNWRDDAAYQEAFGRLLRDLKVTRPPMG